MSHHEAHLDAMLRHLGTAYYDSLHGRASASDVARAVGSVQERVDEHAVGPPTAGNGQTTTRRTATTYRARWHRRVRDVMTKTVVTVDRITPYKEIASLMAEHKVSALPVLMMGRRVAGVVSEADLLRMEDQRERQARAGQRAHPRWRLLGEPWARRKPWGLTAGELMTSPAITIHPDATIPAAARVINQNQVKRLPVVDPDGKLIGIVSRRDLLSVFLRPDEEIADDARGVLTEILFTDPATVKVAVKGGIVTLLGQRGEPEQPDMIPVAVRLIWDVDGVVDVVNKLPVPQRG